LCCFPQCIRPCPPGSIHQPQLSLRNLFFHSRDICLSFFFSLRILLLTFPFFHFFPGRSIYSPWLDSPLFPVPAMCRPLFFFPIILSCIFPFFCPRSWGGGVFWGGGGWCFWGGWFLVLGQWALPLFFLISAIQPFVVSEYSGIIGYTLSFFSTQTSFSDVPFGPPPSQERW